jgi:glycosyltransferase involved in cell wall biosynthesis
MANDLSILIPARNEMFLARTIDDILTNIEADTEVIVVLDGTWATPPIPQNDRVNVVFLPESVGQRAATNIACKLSRAKYVMKVDAHCAFDKGFDRKMIEAFAKVDPTSSGLRRTSNVTMVPIMRNLWAFDWKCLKCGKKWYQGPTPKKCREENYKGTGTACDSTKFIRKMMWIGKHNPQNTSFCFDASPHFQYFEDAKHREPYLTDKKETGLTETMSLQGSCWMLTREKYWDLNISDEAFGSWGSQGIEVAVKTWLSGGRVLVNHNTWYAHMFRTQGGDFSFPYKMFNSDQKKAQAYAKELFFGNKWEKQIYPLSWLVEKFWPVKGWTQDDLDKLKQNVFEFRNNESQIKTEEIEPSSVTLSVSEQPDIENIDIRSNDLKSTENTDIQDPQSDLVMADIANTPKLDQMDKELGKEVKKGIIYFSDTDTDPHISSRVREQLVSITKQRNISVINISSDTKEFGIKRIGTLGLKPGAYLHLRQILSSLEASDSDIIYFCQDNVLYHTSHFDFVPSRKLAYYYNVNMSHLRDLNTSVSIANDQRQISGLCAYRTTLLKHFEKRLTQIENIRSHALENGIKLVNDGITKNLIYNPGLATKKYALDSYKVRTYKSKFPNIYINNNSDDQLPTDDVIELVDQIKNVWRDG